DDEEARMSAGLAEVIGDSLFDGLDISAADLDELAGSLPAVGRAFMALFTALSNARENVRALSERLSDNAFLSAPVHELLTLLTSIRSFSEILHDNIGLADDERRKFLGILVDESEQLGEVINRLQDITRDGGIQELLGAKSPSEEVSDFFESHGNYFAKIEDLADDLHKQAGLGGGALHEGLGRILSERYGLAVETVSWEEQKGRNWRMDLAGGRLLLSEELPHYAANFQLARQIGLRSLNDACHGYLADSRFTSDKSRDMCSNALAKYFAGAVLMPYQPFLEAANELRHDIELLQHRFAVGFEQVCHRLTSLRRPGAAGVPFHFLRIDIAGNILKHYSGSGMRIPRFGGACPRLNIHGAFMTPGMIHRQLVRMPDGAAYFCIARTLMKRGGGYKTPISHLAIGIGCEAAHANRLVYADGISLDNLEAAVPVGVSCRLCERIDCRQRAFGFLMRGTEAAGKNGAHG
ncbi:MAG: short-chain fatty acyl-CoA regulator family protein, partial [Rhodospirillales bacterium]